ncbi:hypothetical protein B0H34DRAFT_803645 [Crassisporium funariophilum]|nr:hypothetical protein B0H34DRAFT_803645 [Crassisporium funariophilum]
MASQQAFQAYPQNKGTLVPGQTIAVNNHTVQVERYLSQGGFAHVYLVRTPTPVYNTTHHVLKRIAVPNESMLTDVKREVDVMRLLKGHPNIVHLIDAAWHKMPNGMYEVFILMEYCPGGGIIDMMNRRLRERLTEAEILQIFVDVCEGVAYMHNSRPALLHRDLKVENILQSSSTSFKLCDFGSAITVSHPPNNMQEIRALEADLNRHTTLQYRAPEMVDVYSKRPINEKSDVWALGVLLYKLCYYTTPFEEHGPLAILNVQYRTPPYPVYSQEMNLLIGSMLREHGAQRPTVFDLLSHVHRLRGTKSKHTYNVPAPPPMLQRPQANINPNPLDGLVTYSTPPTKSAISVYEPNAHPKPPANQGIQAREKVLEAIAPMRRGRPTSSNQSTSSSRPSSPQKPTILRPKNSDNKSSKLDSGFGAEQDMAWKLATDKANTSAGDEWSIGSSNSQKPQKDTTKRPTGFGDDFAEKLWNASDPNSSAALPPRLSPRPAVPANSMKPIRPLAHTGTRQDSSSQRKDAFEGLGLMTTSSKPAPTMGEARKLRTGLATMSTQRDYGHRDSDKANINTTRATPSPRPNYLSTTPSHPQSISPVPTASSSNTSWNSRSPSGVATSSPANTDGLPVESRFPSLEELDAQFTPNPNPLYPSSVNDASNKLPPRRNEILTIGRMNGVRSQQVTGIAMREQKDSRNREGDLLGIDRQDAARNKPPSPSASDARDGNGIPRPTLVRKHRSSVTIKPHILESNKMSEKNERESSSSNQAAPRLPQRPRQSAPRDWLTGESDHEEEVKATTPNLPSEMPILRDSPSKRASFIEQSDFNIPASASAQHVIAPDRSTREPLSADLSPTVSKFKRAFPAIEPIDTHEAQQNPTSSGLTDNWSPVATRREVELDSSSDEGPEDPRSLRSVARKTNPPRAKGRQSSVHELVYQYGGGVVAKENENERERAPVQYGLSDYVPQHMKGRPSSLAPPAKVEVERKTPSPTFVTAKAPAHVPSKSPHRQQSPTRSSQPASGAKSPPSGRSRPQSMFIFPSKSVDSSSALSPGLIPPQEPKPRASRRTSISDMVQRYEAIGGNVNSTNAGAGPPSPLHKPVVATTSITPVENGRLSPSKPRKISNEPPRLSSVSRTPTKPRRNLTLEKDQPARSETVDNSIPRFRKTSHKAEPYMPPPSPRRSVHVPPRSAKVFTSDEPAAKTNPARKPTLSISGVSSPKSDEPRSPSPERPYQGVGKLIDQWQKKSAEADNSRPIPAAKRAGFVSKRAD